MYVYSLISHRVQQTSQFTPLVLELSTSAYSCVSIVYKLMSTMTSPGVLPFCQCFCHWVGCMTSVVLSVNISYCCPDCPSHPVNVTQMGRTAWAIWAAIQKYTLNLKYEGVGKNVCKQCVQIHFIHLVFISMCCKSIIRWSSLHTSYSPLESRGA